MHSSRFARLLGTLCAALAASVWATATVPEAELLEAEQAFAVTARLIDDTMFELRYDIADGYYMYRDRFHFTVDGQPVSLSRQAWPSGKWKKDATFGKVVTYRNRVRLLLPIGPKKKDVEPFSLRPITLTAISQGCADAGICYPPLRQTLLLIPGSSAWVLSQGHAPLSFSHGARPGSELARQKTDGK